MPETRYQLDELNDEERRKLGLGFKSRAQAAIKRRYVEGVAMLQDILAGGQSEAAAAAVEAARQQAGVMEAGASWPEQTFLGALGSTSMIPLHVLGAGAGGPIGGAIASIMAAGAQPYWTHRLAGHEYSRALADAAVQGAIEMLGFDLAKHTLFNPAISAVQKLGRMGGIAAAGEVLEEEAQNLTGKLFDPYKTTKQAFGEAARESPLVAGQTLAQLAAIPLIAIPGSGGVQSQASMVGQVPAEKLYDMNVEHANRLPARQAQAAYAVAQAIENLRLGKDPEAIKQQVAEDHADRPAIVKLINEAIIPNFQERVRGEARPTLLQKPVRQTRRGHLFRNVYGPHAQEVAVDLAADVAGSAAGFTIDARGQAPSKGFAVAAFPDRGLRGLGRVGLDPAEIIDFARQNELLLRQPGNFIGAWRDAQNGGVYLDIARVFTDRKEAEEMGKRFGEIAIYDLANKQEIRLDYKADEIANLSRQPWLSGMQPPKVVTQGLPEGYRLVEESARFPAQRQSRLEGPEVPSNIRQHVLQTSEALPGQTHVGTSDAVDLANQQLRDLGLPKPAVAPGKTIAHFPNAPGRGLPTGYNLVEKQPGVHGNTARLGLRRFEVRGPAFPQGTSVFGTSPQAFVSGVAQRIRELEARNASPASPAEDWGSITRRTYVAHQSAFRDLDPRNREDLLELADRLELSAHGKNRGRAAMVRAFAENGDWREVLMLAREGELTKDGSYIPSKGQAWFLREFVPWYEGGGGGASARARPDQPAQAPPAQAPSPSGFALAAPPGRVLPSTVGTAPYDIVQPSRQPEISPTRVTSTGGPSPAFELTPPAKQPEQSALGTRDMEIVRRASKYAEAIKVRDYRKLPAQVSEADVDAGKEIGDGIHNPAIVEVDGKTAFAKKMFRHRDENGRGELAAYEAQIILGITRVPVRIDGDGDTAIVVKPEIIGGTNIWKYRGKINPKSGMDLFAMDMLGDIRDRHRNNTFVMPGGKVVGIDMDSAFGEFHLHDDERHWLWHRLYEENTEADASMFVKIVDRRAILEARLDEVSGHPGWIGPRLDKVEKLVEKLGLRDNPVVNLAKLEKELRKSGLRPNLDHTRTDW